MTEAKPRRTTIYDLSKRLGISAPTISVVLNGTWQKRRISRETAEIVLRHASKIDYMPNRQAQSLRGSAGTMVGLLIPTHDSRFFATVARAFEERVRQSGRCPVVVSAARDPVRERETTKTLISYSIGALVVCGATDPDGVHDICEKFGVPHVNIDLPGKRAMSIVSDNVLAGTSLTDAVLERLLAKGELQAADIHFVGGLSNLATRDRIKGFKQSMVSRRMKPKADAIQTIGYDAAIAEANFAALYGQGKNVPKGLLIDGLPVFEGFCRFARAHSVAAESVVVGCFDYDPFASFCSFETFMIRQDARRMVDMAMDALESENVQAGIHYVTPELVC
ncbi:LacI family transcriptional regulator [Variovorax sp. AFSI2.2]|uniref:LacI family transcriptional regulator n=1 Tax=Variovorax sp. AFSI2.2 TaxID=3384160 RepID=UPI003EB78F79